MTKEESDIERVEPGGYYRHYGGGTYTALLVARDSENGPNEGRELVVYVSHTTGNVCVRPLAEFTEVVPWPAIDTDGGARRPPRQAPRFSLFPHPKPKT